MTCDHRAAELLPFFWNGSLEPAERDEVEQHLADCATCRAALAETRGVARVFAAHIPTESLLDLAWDRTPAGSERDLNERHLAECPPCTAELELARASRALEDADGIALFRAPASLKPAASAPRARSWRNAALAAGLGGVIAATGWLSTARENDRLLSQMADAAIQRDRVEAGRVEPSPSSTPEAVITPTAPPSTAAGAEPVREVREVEVPKVPTAPIASVYASRLMPLASTDTFRGGDGPAVCRTQHCPIEIAAADLAIAPSYAIEIVAAGGPKAGEVLFVQSNVEPPSSGSFLIQLDTTRLARGSYEVVVYAVEEGARAEQARYPFAVEK